MKSRLSPTLSAGSGSAIAGAIRAPVAAVAIAFALAGGTAAAQDTSAAAVGDPAAGKQKAYTCLGCHGVEHYVNVYPSYHVPRIAGQHAEYIIAALQAYRAGTRAHPTMQSNAAPLNDQDMADIASWLASFGPTSP